jgi:hypothetical protein
MFGVRKHELLYHEDFTLMTAETWLNGKSGKELQSLANYTYHIPDTCWPMVIKKGVYFVFILSMSWVILIELI